MALQQELASVIEGNEAVTGHIISTTVGGNNGEPKQASYRTSMCQIEVIRLES